MTTMFKRAAVALAVVGSVVVPCAAQAQNGPWMVRARAVYLDSDNGGSTTPDLKLSINNKFIPEVDISYFFTPNIAAELILTYPQKQKIRSDGTEIGTLKHLPPTLTVQYHFTGMGAAKPYVGAGINYTKFSSVDLSAVPGADIKRDSWGLAIQAGLDYEISKGMYLNLDLKKVQIGTDVLLGGAKLGDFKVDPWLVGVGLGWRF